MAKLSGVACIAFLICMAILFVPHAQAITCGDVASKLAPCIDYLKNGGTVPVACCDGIKALIDAAKTSADRKTVCNCLKAAAGSIKGIQPGLASGLPAKCGVNVPYPISAKTDCSKVN
ncbi:hypothetical protein ACH5RR_002926 [Cinchona calisaya]|uniref:Non-specific lipid-transfer protein n=1 Tax=Cinchona calisaya TaxID=153742 RepID=A0ABD3ATD3_9GENT